MPGISMDVVIDQLLAVLQEAFEGAPEGWSYFTDRGRESGLFGTLEKLSAAEAAHAIGGSTIAAHARHLGLALAAAAAWIRGDRAPRNWPESWSVSSVDDVAWRRLQEELHDHYKDLRRAIESDATSDEKAMGGSIAALAHAAYHLGAIRQKSCVVASEPETDQDLGFE